MQHIALPDYIIKHILMHIGLKFPHLTFAYRHKIMLMFTLGVSIYPVTGCARRLKPLFNPTMTTNQNRSFNALLSMFVFGAHSRN